VFEWVKHLVKLCLADRAFPAVALGSLDTERSRVAVAHNQRFAGQVRLIGWLPRLRGHQSAIGKVRSQADMPDLQQREFVGLAKGETRAMCRRVVASDFLIFFTGPGKEFG
jgi:hypothetical protein